ncbi:MAG: hypothetical protein K0R36_2746 [Chryseobacterium sp.]|jgi:hypothetical protein|nr:hypothetical protein [Chryseobacterium sp.]
MKKIIICSFFIMGGLVCAKESKQSLNSENFKIKKQASCKFTRYLVTIKTICGTLYQTVYDTDFDSPECLYNEWEMYNQESCGRTSFENPLV